MELFSLSSFSLSSSEFSYEFDLIVPYDYYFIYPI